MKVKNQRGKMEEKQHGDQLRKEKIINRQEETVNLHKARPDEKAGKKRKFS